MSSVLISFLEPRKLNSVQAVPVKEGGGTAQLVRTRMEPPGSRQEASLSPC